MSSINHNGNINHSHDINSKEKLVSYLNSKEYRDLKDNINTKNSRGAVLSNKNIGSVDNSFINFNTHNNITSNFGITAELANFNILD